MTTCGHDEGVEGTTRRLRGGRASFIKAFRQLQTLKNSQNPRKMRETCARATWQRSTSGAMSPRLCGSHLKAKQLCVAARHSSRRGLDSSKARVARARNMFAAMQKRGKFATNVRLQHHSKDEGGPLRRSCAESWGRAGGELGKLERRGSFDFVLDARPKTFQQVL